MIDAIADNFDMTWIDIRPAIVAVTAIEVSRVAVAVEVQDPPRKLEVLLCLRGAIEDLSLEVLILVKVHEGEGKR